MSISQRIDLRQSQTLVMTPQLQQAIKLLQMSNQELGDFVSEEIEQNPLLERAEDSAEADADNALLAGSGSPEREDFAGSASKPDADPLPLSGRETETAPADQDNWASEGMSGE